MFIKSTINHQVKTIDFSLPIRFQWEIIRSLFKKIKKKSKIIGAMLKHRVIVKQQESYQIFSMGSTNRNMEVDRLDGPIKINLGQRFVSILRNAPLLIISRHTSISQMVTL